MGIQKPNYLSEEQMGHPSDTSTSPVVDAINKYAIDPINSLASGIVRGTAGLIGTPGSLYSYAREKLDPSYDASKNPMTIENMTKGANYLYTAGNKALGAENAPDVYYQGEKGSPAYYAGKIGEFATPIPGGGETNLIRDIVAPAIGSTVAGDLASEYLPSAQPYASVVGALAGHRLASGAENVGKTLAGNFKPVSGSADDLRSQSVDYLRKAGVPITAGTAIGDRALMAKEASTPRGAAAIGSYPEAVTSSLMKEGLGVKGLATPNNVANAEGRIVGKLTSIADSVSPIPAASDTAALKNAVSDAQSISTSTNVKVPDFVDKFIKKVDDAAANGVPISGDELRKIRTQVNRAKSNMAKDGIGDIAAETVDLIDNMVERELTSAGRLNDLSDLQESRYQYRNLLSMQNALKSAFENNGILQPRQITSGLFRQGKAGYLRGARGDFADLSGHAANLQDELMKPVAADTGAKFADEVMRSAVNSGLPYALTNQMGLLGMPVAYAAEKGIPYAVNKVTGIGRRAMMTKPVQSYLEARGYVPEWTQSKAMKDIMPGLIASLASRQGRKAGGRVANHLTAADQLVRAAERAKKRQSAQTEALLQQPDSAVAHALEVANRSI